MKPFNEDFINNYKEYSAVRKPDFNNILKILDKKKPDRYTLFEFFLNGEIYMKLAGLSEYPKTADDNVKMLIDAFRVAGYDYVTVGASGFYFKNAVDQHGKKSRSMSEASSIYDRESYDAYIWNNPDDFFDTNRFEKYKDYLPDGMKFIVSGPGGVIENVISIVGYEQLCLMISDDPELVQMIFDNVGSRLVRYYELALNYDSIGAFISNDDWGFATQTMLSVADMRRFVFPWHVKISETIHSAGKPVLLHSCGQAREIYDDIIDVMHYDGKHSYEDKILPVEDTYEELKQRIAVMGGIDLDFVCRRSPEEIYDRSCAMLTRAENRGAYALGTGNSVPYYVPYENYLAMTAAAVVNSI
jgi:uroporphyrinogen decarboxylase